MIPRSAHPFDFAPSLAALAVVAATCVLAFPARSAWLPLAVGNEWHYVDDGGDPHVEVITEPVRVRGRPMFVKSYVGGLDDGLVNFWMLDADGSVLLGGYYRALIPFGLVYEPPVRIFPGSPAVGLEWSQHTRAIAIPDNVTFAEFDSDWRVQQQVRLSVPAGEFECFGVGQIAPPEFAAAPQGRALALDGRLAPASAASLSPGPASASEWYADGVGLVQYRTDVPYVLTACSLPTPVASSSWGRIKGLYR